MGQKHYSKAIRNEAVLFYERGHSFAETRAKYGMAESTFFEWKKRFDQEYPLYELAGGSTKAARNAQLHLEKLALELEVVFTSKGFSSLGFRQNKKQTIRHT